MPAFNSDNPANIRESRQLMNMDIPFAADERFSKMIDMVYDIFNNFFSGRTLKVKVPKFSSEDAMRALDEGNHVHPYPEFSIKEISR